MIYYVGNTDRDWFNFLRIRKPEDINFWQPGGTQRFHVIEPGSPFLLRLKRPINKIAGIGFYTTHSLLPVDFAWEVFQEKNGAGSLGELSNKINTFRKQNDTLDIRATIGCLVLSNPIFFDETDWLDTPSDWQANVVSGKKYDSTVGCGKKLWESVEALLHKYRLYDSPKARKTQFVVAEDSLTDRYGAEVLTRVRLGQGAFRIMITDAYQRKCAISGERTLPALDAAHIKPYDSSGPHSISNGLLLRSDIHRLFDKGYLTISPEYVVEVSRRIKEEYENGREYYQYRGKQIVTCPANENDRPSREFIDWHNREIYKG
jgi:putative restriction endonuclease